MLKYIWYLIIGLGTLSASAQSTVVSGTLVDPSGTIWSAATITAQFHNAPNRNPPFNWDGGAYNPLPPTIVADGTGTFSITVPSNDHIVPAGSTWLFHICPNASLPCADVNISVTGGSVNIVPILNTMHAWPTGSVNATPIATAYTTNEVGPPPSGQGSMIFNTSTQTIDIFTQAGWVPVGGSGSGSVLPSPQFDVALYPLTGSQGTVQGTHFLTIDASGAIRPVTTNPAIDTTLRFQSQFFDSLGYTTISPPGDGVGTQGSSQIDKYNEVHWVAPGWSNGIAGCPLFCPKAGYTSVTNWLSIGSNFQQHFFNGAGIHQGGTLRELCYGIGDCTAGTGYTRTGYSGGYSAPSDEGLHGNGAAQMVSNGDGLGTIASITDTTHLKLTLTNPFWGQGRFVMDTSSFIMQNGSASLDFAPGMNGHPYATMQFNNVTLPVSYATGTMNGECTVPTQDSGTAAATCSVNVNGTTPFDTAAPVCMAESSAQLYNFGVQVTAVSALVSGVQTLTFANLRRSVGLTTAWIFQGGTCGMMLDLLSDHGNWGASNELVSGSVYPVFGSLDAHTVVLFSYNSSQAAASVPAAVGSAFRSEGFAASATDISGGKFSLALLQRVGSVVTATLTSGLGGFPRAADVLVNQKFFTIAGCSDTTLNGVQSNAITLIGATATTISYAQTGADSAVCPTATVFINGTLANLSWGAELYNVTNPASSTPATAVDGTFVTSYQPNFVVGHSMDSPPHYSGNVTGTFNNMQMGQPMRSSIGSEVILNNLSAYGSTGFFVTALQIPQRLQGFGGDITPPTAYGVGPGFFLTGLDMSFNAPASGGAIIRAGFSPNASTGMKHYSVYQLGLGTTSLNYDEPSTTLSNILGGKVVSTISPTALVSLVPHTLANPIFQGLTSGGAPISTNQLHDCGARGGYSTVCYGQFLTVPLTAAIVGTAGANSYNWVMIVHFPYGDEFGPFTTINNGNAVLDTTNFIALTCTGLPAGLTGSIYQFANPNFKKVGDCASAASVVNDQGTYGPNLGSDALTLSAPWYAGADFVSPLGAFGWVTGGFANTPGVALAPTAMISQPTAGVLSVDTTTKGNTLGTIKAAAVVQTGATSFTDTELNCTIVFVNGIATTHTGTGCP